MNNFKVIATNNYEVFVTKGKIYEFIDGIVEWDNGGCSYKYKNFEDFLAKNINFKGSLELYKDNITFKVICVKGDNYFVTKGKIYEFIDGITTWDNGSASEKYLSFEDFIIHNVYFLDLIKLYEKDKYTMDIHEVLNLDIGTILDSNDGRHWKVWEKFNKKRTLKNMNDCKNIVLDSCTLELKFKTKEVPYKILPFLDAIKAYKNGSAISCKTSGCLKLYSPGEDKLNLNLEEILNGEWRVQIDK